VTKLGGYSRTQDTADGILARWLVTGDESARAELRSVVGGEYRASNAVAMVVGTDAAGGDLVPVGFFDRIVERARPMDLSQRLPLRTVAGVGTSLDVPIDNEADDGGFVSTSESGEYDLDSPAVDKVTLTLLKYTKQIRISEELLADTPANLLEFLTGYIGAGMAARMNQLIVTEVLANGTAALTADAPTTIGAAEVPELFYKLSAEYAAGEASVAWLARRSTEGHLRSISSSSQFTFAPTPGGEVSPRSTLWGFPLVTDSNMGAMAASAKSLLIANWNYVGIRRAAGLQVLRDPYSRAAYGELVLHCSFRTAIRVLQPAAVQYLTHPTS